MSKTYIDKILTTNSDVRLNRISKSRVLPVQIKDAYRPDKIYGRNAYMKISMMLDGIDTPHRLAPGAVHSLYSPTDINYELLGLVDFKV